MIPRYTRPEMGRIFGDEFRFQQWLEVELASTEALAELGDVPTEAAQALRYNQSFRRQPGQQFAQSADTRAVALFHTV